MPSVVTKSIGITYMQWDAVCVYSHNVYARWSVLMCSCSIYYCFLLALQHSHYSTNISFRRVTLYRSANKQCLPSYTICNNMLEYIHKYTTCTGSCMRSCMGSCKVMYIKLFAPTHGL
jgi:hypothetical protein